MKVLTALTIISTGTSNIRSVVTAFTKMGIPTEVSTDPHAIERARALVLPGVGAFGEAMTNLRHSGIAEAIRNRVLGDGVPLLGICLGMQLLADVSEERGEHEGLGLVPGRIIRLTPRSPDALVPNIGWHPVAWHNGRKFADTGSKMQSYYFVHSYQMVCNDPGHVVGTIDFGGRPVTAAVAKGSIFATQFHPEKSQDAGLNLLARFVTSVGFQPTAPGT